MDLNDFWQENKRFVLTVAGGLLAFLIGLLVVSTLYGDDLSAARRNLSRTNAELGKARYVVRDRDRAQDQHDALVAALADLDEIVVFQPRPRFAVGDANARTRYFQIVSEAREEILAKAGRAGLKLPGDLGLPLQSPTKELEIVRTLEALDIIDRSVQLALEAGVDNIARIAVRLDPRLLSGKSFTGLERTRVELQLKGPSEPMSRFLLLTQQPRFGQALMVDDLEFEAGKNAGDAASMTVTLLAAHMHGVEAALAGEIE